MLSDLPLSGATWADILKDTPMAKQPLQAMTFYDMATYASPDTGGDGKTPWGRLTSLPLSKVPFVTSLWRNVPLGAVLLGNTRSTTFLRPAKPDGS